MTAYMTTSRPTLPDDECAEIVNACAQHIRAWGGVLGVTPDMLAANVRQYQALHDDDRIRVCVWLTKSPSMAVTTTNGVRWYRRDLAPENAWSAAA